MPVWACDAFVRICAVATVIVLLWLLLVIGVKVYERKHMGFSISETATITTNDLVAATVLMLMLCFLIVALVWIYEKYKPRPPSGHARVIYVDRNTGEVIPDRNLSIYDPESSV